MLADAAKQDIAEREVTILGDRNTPYSVLRKVMATCTDAEYGKVSLAVIERETEARSRRARHRVADQLSRCNRHDTRSLLSPLRPALVADRGSRAAFPQGRCATRFIVFAIFAILIPLLPVPEQRRVKAPDIPDRIVKLVIEKKAPPPPPPPPKIEEKKPEPVKKVEQPKPQPPKPDAREQAQKSGLLKLQDQLADLRDNSMLDKAAMTKNLTGKVGETTRSERSLITSKVGASSGGINTASLSRGYGGGAGSLTGHTTTQVTSAVLAAQGTDNVERGAGSGKASRSEEEIALVFDRNKGAIYALYTRALRDKPDLQGKLVLELTIAAGRLRSRAARWCRASSTIRSWSASSWRASSCSASRPRTSARSR